ncbi:hypothetical protein Tco_1142424 [Tanacetum coccineum]
MGVTRTKKYAELSAAEKIQANCDMKATNIILQGLPADIYSLVNHHRVAKDLWERVQLLMQVNTKFLNSLPPEWSKFVTDVKLVKDLHTTNFDQLHAYLEQHELHANEVRLLRECNQDPLEFVANQSIHPNQHYSSTYPSQPQFNQSPIPPSYPYQSQMNHQTSSVPQIYYQSPQVTIQPMNESPLMDSSFAVPVFSLRDDPNSCLNKAMAFLTAVASSRVMLLVLGETMQVDRQALLNATTVKDKAMLAEAQEAGQILDEEQLAFLADPRVSDGKAVQTIIPNNVPYSEIYLNDMENQSVHAMQDFEQTSVVDFTNNEIHSDSNIILLSDDFRKHFTPQEELSIEQAFWLRMSNPTSKPSDASPVKIEAPKEFLKVSLVNESLKKLKFHLARFDNVVKIRTIPDARTEDEWGFEHTKAVFNNEIIPFLKYLKEIFNVFDRDLLNEIMEVQIVFDQMDDVVQQSSVDKQCLEIAKKELLLEND